MKLFFDPAKVHAGTGSVPAGTKKSFSRYIPILKMVQTGTGVPGFPHPLNGLLGKVSPQGDTQNHLKNFSSIHFSN